MLAAQPQLPLNTGPYDRWISPDGRTVASFHRESSGLRLRFYEQADFLLDLVREAADCIPVPGIAVETLEALHANAIVPLLANYRGGHALHGSAVAIGEAIVAFTGLSRSGKSTLAGAFAAAGYPYLSEDALLIEPCAQGHELMPARPGLRLFADSAEHLGTAMHAELPHRDTPGPLAALLLLDTQEPPKPVLERLEPATALVGLLQHAFILDVEDRARLQAHFGRIGELAETVPCYRLDYRRNYAQLPDVIALVAGEFA